MIQTVLALLVLAVILLGFGAVVQWRRGEQRKAVLLVILALVAALNVGIWTIPDASGEAPVSKATATPA